MPPPPPVTSPLPHLLRTALRPRSTRLSPPHSQGHIRVLSRTLSTTPARPHYLTGTNTSATIPPTWFDSSHPSHPQQQSRGEATTTTNSVSSTSRDASVDEIRRSGLGWEKDSGVVRGHGNSRDNGRAPENGIKQSAPKVGEESERPSVAEEPEPDQEQQHRRYDPDHEPPDERTIQLGRTIRTLQTRMPTLLHSPLPTSILSPHISLQLFPSTHPDLPIVRGRVAYIAALWTSPVAWGHLPGSSTHLEVLSERMLPDERLKIRWRALPGRSSENNDSSTSTSGGGEEERAKEIHMGTTTAGDKSFQGIFIFEFDEYGRVVRHVIENAEEDESHVGGVITVTEWLMRAAKSGRLAGAGGKRLAWECRRGDKE
ncbi:hypothetical protein EX30DRAFT_366483 [Ascodesmis nigricans]|uniref:Uncharacterized protein n=1 Tax=Ascodesmis nigricans TaxID=341454 RepID=A0A4S2MRJ8_9PEZI|nr:hypothetical protein EX30DRAFT_366483 [Ascodesmis nigricans]